MLYIGVLLFYIGKTAFILRTVSRKASPRCHP